jgi:DNA-binding transcriptional LysR family regulator
MNFSDVYVFNKVAATLSFTEAAREIGSSRSAISKKISRLEQALGVTLINRNTRSASLTEAGRVFHRHTSDIDTKIERAADIVRGTDLRPTGTVAFTLPSSLGAALMPALLTQFRTTWPELKLSIHFSDHLVDLITGSFDLAIRISQKLSDSNLVSRRLASTRKVLAASPGYLDKYGVPTDISELKDHRCLGIGSAVQTGTTWRLQDQDSIVEVPCTYSISANNKLAIVLAACLDNGIVYLPEVCICNELVQQRLRIILPESSDPQPYGIYAVYPHRNAAAKVKVLVNFIEQELSAMPTIDRWAPLVKDPSQSEEQAAGESDRYLQLISG